MAQISVTADDLPRLKQLHAVAVNTGAESFIYVVEQEMVTAYVGYLIEHLEAITQEHEA